MGVQRQASEGHCRQNCMRPELGQVDGYGSTLHKGEQVWGRWSSLPCVREARPPPDSSSGVLAHCPTLPPRSTLRHLFHFSTWTSGNGLTEASGLPGGKALTPLSVTPLALQVAVAVWLGPAVSPTTAPRWRS